MYKADDNMGDTDSESSLESSEPTTNETSEEQKEESSETDAESTSSDEELLNKADYLASERRRNERSNLIYGTSEKDVEITTFRDVMCSIYSFI